MSYVDGFVLPVPTDKLEEYLRTARIAAEVWKEYGALEVVETVADDVKHGEQTSFPRSVQARENETVVLSWIRYATREERDRINEAVLKDPRIEEMMRAGEFPVDGKRMFWGGFTELLRQ